MSPPSNLTLLVDADDTMWENEAHFREAAEWFLDLMQERGHDRDGASRRLREIESERCARLGYGSLNFARSLVDTVAALDGACPRDLEERLLAMGDAICNYPIELFPGVFETLSELKTRHTLHVVTKGQHDEQSGKVARSGVRHHFGQVEVLPEKDLAQYRALVERLKLDLDRTWMIGNSPRSDINPARAVGMRTVFIPHRTIWELEDATLDGEPELRCRRFRELLDHF
ncbi:MAG: hypothetical protein CMJ83_04700 [Planctomycetes bacterium]|nr:hypothetical protein [Planctomycetota bacterium]